MDTTTMLIGITISVLLLAIILTIPITLGLQWLYRRAILRGMLTDTGEDNEEESPAAEGAPKQKPALKMVRLVRGDGAAPNPWLKNMEQKRSRLAAIYIAAGFAFIITFTIFFLISEFSSILIGRLAFLLVLHSWPLMLTTNMMLVRDRKTSAIMFAGYFILFSLLVLFFIVTGISDASLPEFWLTWVILNVPPYIFLQLIISRPIRSVGPIVFTMMLAVSAGIVIPLSILGTGPMEVVFGIFQQILTALGLQSLVFLAFIGLIILAGLVFAVPAGWLVLKQLGAQYRKKQTSDQFIVADVVWLIYAGYWTLIQIPNGLVWAFSGFISFLVYKAVIWAGLRFARQQGATAPPKLLLLRVFSLGRKSEEFYETFSNFWRYIGTIQFITGPDLLRTTIQPHRFLEFLGGKLSTHFVNHRAAFERRMNDLDMLPDPDGRYRINDFFCRDNTWKMVLKRLASESDIVLMDLRSFSSRNAGCRFEVNALFQLIPLRRVVFLVDQTTDKSFLDRVMQETWSNLDPNSPNVWGNGEVYYFEYNKASWNEFRGLFQAITEIVPI